METEGALSPQSTDRADPTDPAKRAAPSASPPLRLFSLGGDEPPPDLSADLLRLLRLPAEALQNLWQILAPSLAEKLTEQTEELFDVFCAAYHVDEESLGRAVKACRFLIQSAARLDVSSAALGDDLDRLCPDQALVKELVLAGYEPAKERIRMDILKAAVSDHGKLLVGVNWRVDGIRASERGVKLGMPIAMLTLHYREGVEVGRVTLQVLPDMMSELRSVCDKVLG